MRTGEINNTRRKERRVGGDSHYFYGGRKGGGSAVQKDKNTEGLEDPRSSRATSMDLKGGERCRRKEFREQPRLCVKEECPPRRNVLKE